MDRAKAADRAARKTHVEFKRLLLKRMSGATSDQIGSVFSGAAAALIDVLWSAGSGNPALLRKLWLDMGDNYIKQIEAGHQFGPLQ